MSPRGFVLAALALALNTGAAADPAAFDALARRFAESEFIFNRGRSDIPFVPLAWIDASSYGQSRFLTPSGNRSDLSFEQKAVSEGTLVPFLLGPRDALLIGQWTSWSRLSLSSGNDINVVSLSVPFGWARQTSPDWQLAAFVAPVGHVNAGEWYWELMGGAFARWLESDHLVWIFGFYADFQPLENFYVPYVGLTWTIDQHWTLSAVMPWPALLFAPTPDWLLRLGIAPSGASWFAQVDSKATTVKQPRITFTSWDTGLSVEKRVWRGVWIGAEAGVAGLRGLSFTGSDWKGPNSELGLNGYVALKINYRPQGVGGPH
jgi:hypothetical protein